MFVRAVNCPQVADTQSSQCSLCYLVQKELLKDKRQFKNISNDGPEVAMNVKHYAQLSSNKKLYAQSPSDTLL